jgi:hypothetical protein
MIARQAWPPKQLLHYEIHDILAWKATTCCPPLLPVLNSAWLKATMTSNSPCVPARAELPLSHRRLSTAQPLPSKFCHLFATINISLHSLALPSCRLPPSYHPSSCASCPVDHFSLLSTGISPPYISLSKRGPSCGFQLCSLPQSIRSVSPGP